MVDIYSIGSKMITLGTERCDKFYKTINLKPGDWSTEVLYDMINLAFENGAIIITKNSKTKEVLLNLANLRGMSIKVWTEDIFLEFYYELQFEESPILIVDPASTLVVKVKDKLREVFRKFNTSVLCIRRLYETKEVEKTLKSNSNDIPVNDKVKLNLEYNGGDLVATVRRSGHIIGEVKLDVEKLANSIVFTDEFTKERLFPKEKN